MRLLLITGLLIANLHAFNDIKISQEQQKDLGVKLQNITVVENICYGPYNGVTTLDKKDVIFVSPNIESVVEKIHVREFENVKKGQKLVTLKSNLLLNMQQEFIQALIEQGNSEENYQRDLKLFDKGIISRKKMLESKKVRDRYDVQVKLAQTQLFTNGLTPYMIRQIKITHNPIQRIIKYASRDAIVRSVNVNIGEYIAAEQKMVELFADGKRFVDITVPLKDIENVKIGDKVKFDDYMAKVTAIGNSVNNKSQSVLVRAEIDDAKDIMINRIYQVNIGKKISQAYKIKKSALVYNENRSYVFEKNAEGFRVIEVKILREGPSCYIVTGDLNKDSSVAASSTSALLSAMEEDDE